MQPAEISPQLVERFNRLWPLLEASLNWSAYRGVWRTHDREHVLQRVKDGKAQFWPGDQSAFVTEIYHHPTGLRSQSNWVAGGDLDELKEIMRHIEAYGRDRGCHRQIGTGRRGWTRVFGGYEELGFRKQKDLLA